MFPSPSARAVMKGTQMQPVKPTIDSACARASTRASWPYAGTETGRACKRVPSSKAHAFLSPFYHTQPVTSLFYHTQLAFYHTQPVTSPLRTGSLNRHA